MREQRSQGNVYIGSAYEDRNLADAIAILLSKKFKIQLSTFPLWNNDSEGIDDMVIGSISEETNYIVVVATESTFEKYNLESGESVVKELLQITSAQKCGFITMNTMSRSLQESNYSINTYKPFDINSFVQAVKDLSGFLENQIIV